MENLVIKVLVRYGSTALLTLGPMFTLNWSLLDLFGVETIANKEAVELSFRLLVSGGALSLGIAAEVLDFYLPSVHVRKFRRSYLDSMSNGWLKKFPEEVQSEFRFCLLDVRHPWYWGFVPKFERAWRGGTVAANHPDKKFFLLGWQGVAGEARKEHAHRWRRFDTPFSQMSEREQRALKAEYRMSGRQLRRFEHIRAILCVPVLQRRSDDPNDGFRCVGVLSVEALTPGAATVLAANWDQLGKDLAIAIADVGNLRV